MSVREIVMSAAGANDAIPDQFTFSDRTNANINTSYSASVTPTGYDSSTWTVSGGEGSVDNVNWATSGTIIKGQTFYVRGTSSSLYSTTVNVVATIGAIVSDTFSITTRAVDLVPDAFTFTDVNNTNLSTITTSGTITVTGVDPSQSITVSVSGGEVDAGTSTLSGTWSSTSKTVTSSASGTFVIAARASSSSSYGTAVNVVVTIGGVSDTYTITTKSTPQPSFTFTDTTGAEVGISYTSSTVTATGLDAGQSISISATGGTIDAGTSSLSGTFASSKTVTASASGTFVIAAKGTASLSYDTAVNIVVTAGTTSDTYTITTRVADTTPDAFAFTDASGVEINTLTTSAGITPTGYDYASWTVTGGEGSVNLGTWATSGTIGNGQAFYVRGTSSGSYSTSVNVVATIGGVSDTFIIKTRAADATPVTFAFTDVTGVERSTSVTSDTIVVTGLEPNYNVVVSSTNATFDAGTSALSGTFVSYKTVTSNSTGAIVIAAKQTSSANFLTQNSAVITVGTVSDTWNVTTRIANTTANAFTFTDVTGASANTDYTSSTVTVTGLEPNYNVTVYVFQPGYAPYGNVDAGTSTLSGTFALSKTVTTSANGTIVIAAKQKSNAWLGGSNYTTVYVGNNSIYDTY